MDNEYDVIIVGARVGGAILAAILGDAGHHVLLVDKASFPSPTLSTHFFRGQYTLEVFQRIGVLDDVLALGAPPLTKQYFYSNGSAEPAVQPPQLPGKIGYCLSVRRETLDEVLVRRAARSSSVHFMEKTSVRGLLSEEGRVVGVSLKTRDNQEHEVRARLVVGADGRESLVAREVDAAYEDTVPPFRVMYYEYVSDYASPDGEPHAGPEFSLLGEDIAYVFPSDGDLACVAVSVVMSEAEGFKGHQQADFARRLSRHKGLAQRFANARPVGKIFSFNPKDNYVRVPVGPGWALVGDAGQYQDPWSGVGMDSASTAACILGDAINDWFTGKMSEAEGMRHYHDERNAICVPMFNDTVAQGRP